MTDHQPTTRGHVDGRTGRRATVYTPPECLVPCPSCTGPARETVGMVCQTCGTDYAAPRVDLTRPVRPPTVTESLGRILARAVCALFGHTTDPCVTFCLACSTDLPRAIDEQGGQ